MFCANFRKRLNSYIFVRIESYPYLDYFSFVSVSRQVTLNKPQNKPSSKNRYLFSSHRGKDGAVYGDSADIQGDTRNIRRRMAAVEIGLTFTAINVVSNNATTEKAVTNVEIKGSERGKKGSRW